MLSDTSTPVIKATLPVVGENIQEIAQRFYAHMFGEHPELLDGLFNRGNQADGRQQQALAGSIAAFATTLIENPDDLPDHLLRPGRDKGTRFVVSTDSHAAHHFDTLAYGVSQARRGWLGPSDVLNTREPQAFLAALRRPPDASAAL